MSLPPAGASAGAAVGAPAGGGSVFARSSDVARGQAVSKDVAELIAEVVLAVPGVAGLHGGPFGTVATYLPGRRITGVAVREDPSGDPQRQQVEVFVVAAAQPGLGVDLQALAARIRTAVTPLVSGAVDVTIADLVGPTA